MTADASEVNQHAQQMRACLDPLYHEIEKIIGIKIFRHQFADFIGSVHAVVALGIPLGMGFTVVDNDLQGRFRHLDVNMDPQGGWRLHTCLRDCVRPEIRLKS